MGRYRLRAVFHPQRLHIYAHRGHSLQALEAVQGHGVHGGGLHGDDDHFGDGVRTARALFAVLFSHRLRRLRDALQESALGQSDAQNGNEMGFGFAAQSLRLQSRGAQFADAQIARQCAEPKRRRSRAHRFRCHRRARKCAVHRQSAVGAFAVSLKLFKGMVYTAAVFTATMITSAMAFGQLGPFSLYCFLIGYAVYATHCKKVHSAKVTRKMETKWDSVSQRNPFDFKAEAPNSLTQSAEGRARIVFDVIAERENAQCIDKAQLARLLCPSGVVMSEVEKSFAELCDEKAQGIAFAVFLQRLPSVWQWYFEYMAEAVANFDERAQ